MATASGGASSLEDAVKATQECFKPLIRKPPMTEKLLSRPPFRYMHDVLMELGKKYKFLSGLYSGGELDSDSFKDKEAKVAFLQKCLDVMAILHGKGMPCKASRVVSGQEPEKTNAFLQLIAQTVSSKTDTKDAVKQVLAKTKGKDAGSEGAAAAAAKEPSDKKTSDRKHRSSKEPAAEDPAKASAAEASAAVDAKDGARPKDGKSRRRTRDEESKKEEEKASKSKDKEGSRRSESKQKDDGKGKEEDKVKDSKGKDEDRERRRAERKERERAKEEKARKKGESADSAPKVEEPAEASQQEERPPSPKGQKRGHRTDSVEDSTKSEQPGAKQPSSGTQEADFLRPPLPPGQQTSSHSGPSSGKSRGPGRPSSARPAPPKLRSRQNSAGSEEALSRVSSNVAVQSQLVLDDKEDDDVDDMFEVEPSFAPQPAADDLSFTVDKDTDPAEHGQLVRKILDTKKELDQDTRQSTQESAASLAMRRKRREKTDAEVAKLRECVQTLCRSANPLAKAVDYIQEDVESMLKELKQWQTQAQTNSADLSKERETTEAELEPLRQNLAELDAGILEQMELIGVLKANVAKNDQQMSQLVNGIALACRQ